MSKHRTRREIQLSVLTVLRSEGGLSAYELSLRARTNNAACRDITKMLLHGGLIAVLPESRIRRYVITQKGIEFIDGYGRHLASLNAVSSIEWLVREVDNAKS